MNNFAVAIIFLVVIAAGVGAFFYFEYMEPLEKEAAELTEEIESLERQKAQLENIEEEMKQLETEISELTEEKNKLQMESNQLNTVVPKLLDSTETIANKYDIKFQDIRISPLVRAEEWSELPIEITVQGPFSKIGNFLKIMEQRKIINLAAGSMNVSVSAEVDRKTKSPMLSVVISAKVYIMGSGL
ncbi:MAG: type 4a pilus biogenesis protein PilO [Candidatus Rifleibacteriota bacterium]